MVYVPRLSSVTTLEGRFESHTFNSRGPAGLATPSGYIVTSPPFSSRCCVSFASVERSRRPAHVNNLLDTVVVMAAMAYSSLSIWPLLSRQLQGQHYLCGDYKSASGAVGWVETHFFNLSRLGKT